MMTKKQKRILLLKNLKLNLSISGETGMITDLKIIEHYVGKSARILNYREELCLS